MVGQPNLNTQVEVCHFQPISLSCKFYRISKHIHHHPPFKIHKEREMKNLDLMHDIRKFPKRPYICWLLLKDFWRCPSSIRQMYAQREGGERACLNSHGDDVNA